MRIDINFDTKTKTYTVEATDGNKEAILECLSEDDVNRLTIRELKSLINAE